MLQFKTIPNLITLVRFLMFFWVLYTFFNDTTAIRISGFVVFLIVFGMDKLDGYIARKYNQVSDVGKFFDLAIDRTIVTCLLVTYVYLFPNPVILFLVLANLIRDFLVGGIRQLAAYKNFFLKAHILGKLKFISENSTVILVSLLLALGADSVIGAQLKGLTEIVLGVSTILGWGGLAVYIKQLLTIKE